MDNHQYNIVISIIIFSLINVIIGFFSRRGSKLNAEIYIASTNSTSSLMLTTSLMGTIIGGGMFFSVAQLGYEAGFAGVYLGISYLVGFILLGCLSKKIRCYMITNSSITIYDCLENILGSTHLSKKIVNLFRICTSLLYILFLSAQIIVISTFIQTIFSNYSHLSILIACTLIFIFNSASYTIFGGLKKDIITDGWQMILVIIGVLLIAVIMFGDFHGISTLPPTYYYGTNKGVVLLIGLILFSGPSLLLRPDMWQRIITAKNDDVAKKSFFISGILSFFGFSFFTIIGVYAKTLNYEAGNVFLFKITSSSDELISTLIIVSLFGAVASSADTFLNVCSFTIASLIKRKIKNDKDISLFNLRKITFVVSVISLVIAFFFSDLIDIFASGFGLLFIFFPIFYIAIKNRNVNQKALYHSSLVSIFIYFSLVFFIPKEAFLPSMILSTCSYFIFNKFYLTEPACLNNIER